MCHLKFDEITKETHFCFRFFLAAGSKLRRLRSALDANLITTPYPSEYQDVHVIASVLKSYLRDLPDPLLTFNLYDQFIAAAQRPTEETRKVAILNAINQLPEKHYLNLRYLMKFLGKLLASITTPTQCGFNFNVSVFPLIFRITFAETQIE